MEQPSSVHRALRHAKLKCQRRGKQRVARKVPRLCQLAASKRRRRNTIPTCAYIPSVTYFAHWPSQRGHQRRRKSTCTTRVLNLGCVMLPFYWFKTKMFVCVCVRVCVSYILSRLFAIGDGTLVQGHHFDPTLVEGKKKDGGYVTWKRFRFDCWDLLDRDTCQPTNIVECFKPLAGRPLSAGREIRKSKFGVSSSSLTEYLPPT